MCGGVVSPGKGYGEYMLVEGAQTQRKVLMLSASALVRDNVRVLLRSMGYHCLVASTLKEAVRLLAHENPDAAILDPQQADSSPARIVATFHKSTPRLRGRVIVLISEEGNLDLLQVLDAYSVAWVRLDALLQELWPCLDSLLHRAIVPHQVPRRAPLIFDSFRQLPVAGVRSWVPSPRQLLYESETLVADLSLEGQKDSQRITLAGQVLDSSNPKPQLSGIQILLQGPGGLIDVSRTNAWGEFRFEFDFELGVTLEIQAKAKSWVSVALPDLSVGGSSQESQISGASGDSEAQSRHPKRKTEM